MCLNNYFGFKFILPFFLVGLSTSLNTSFISISPRNEATNGFSFRIDVETGCRWWRLLHVTLQITNDKVDALRVGNTKSATLYSGCSRKGNFSYIVAGKFTVGPPFESAVTSVPIRHIFSASKTFSPLSF